MDVITDCGWQIKSNRNDLIAPTEAQWKIKISIKKNTMSRIQWKVNTIPDGKRTNDVIWVWWCDLRLIRIYYVNKRWLPVIVMLCTFLTVYWLFKILSLCCCVISLCWKDCVTITLVLFIDHFSSLPAQVACSAGLKRHWRQVVMIAVSHLWLLLKTAFANFFYVIGSAAAPVTFPIKPMT